MRALKLIKPVIPPVPLIRYIKQKATHISITINISKILPLPQIFSIKQNLDSSPHNSRTNSTEKTLNQHNLKDKLARHSHNNIAANTPKTIAPIKKPTHSHKLHFIYNRT